jgi:hypothetical protein
MSSEIQLTWSNEDMPRSVVIFTIYWLIIIKNLRLCPNQFTYNFHRGPMKWAPGYAQFAEEITEVPREHRTSKNPAWNLDLGSATPDSIHKAPPGATHMCSQKGILCLPLAIQCTNLLDLEIALRKDWYCFKKWSYLICSPLLRFRLSQT